MDRETLKHNFEAHGFATAFFKDGAAATAWLADRLKGCSIGFGGSVTLAQLGLYKALAAENQVVWHHRVNTPAIKALAAGCQVYISSANAVAATGELVNIDGAGNRIAMTLYGPREVYFVVGENKLCPNLPAALHRAQNVAAPKNAHRLQVKTPCASKGDRCYNCASPERICRCTAVLNRAPSVTPTTVIFVDEDLGY